MTTQRWVGRVTGPLWLPVVFVLLRLVAGYRVSGAENLRREFRENWGESPILICANHLTLADPALVLLALGTPLWFLRHPGAAPWTVLAVENVARIFPGCLQPLHYILKCIPIPRGQGVRETGAALRTIGRVLLTRDCVVIFPEGRRGRGGRVDTAARTYGVGRLLTSVPTCRVLCLYIRGDRQETWGDAPQREERFRVGHTWLEPTTGERGMRASLDLTGQVMRALAHLELLHFQGAPRAVATERKR